jgi:hypothetical protein
MMKIEDLWDELRVHPGRFALVVGDCADATVAAIAAAIGQPVIDVSRHLTVEHEDGWQSPDEILSRHAVLRHIEVLFSPEVPADPLRLLTMLARRGPVIASWPGTIEDGRALFSRPGRHDHFDQPLPSSALVLRAIPTTFPDEVPYEVERVR